jgi:hypothetical protein
MKNTIYSKVNFKCSLVVILILSHVFILFAQDHNSAAAYIRMGLGARVIAMGEAGSAVTNDVTSIYWNPAGLNNMKDIEFSSMYSLNMGYDRSLMNAAIGKRFHFGSLALNWINASTSDIEGYDESDQPTGYFSDSNHNIALSFANNVKRFQYGVSTKIYLSMMDGDSKSGMGIDIGAKYDLNQYLVAGLMVRDLYGKLGEDKIPYQFSVGIAAYPFIGITLAADLKKETDEAFTYAFGAEYWTSIGKDSEANSKLSVINVAETANWKDLFNSTQAGIRLGFNDGRFSIGSGLKLRNLQFDYVYRINNHDIFNDEHIVSTIIRF